MTNVVYYHYFSIMSNKGDNKGDVVVNNGFGDMIKQQTNATIVGRVMDALLTDKFDVWTLLRTTRSVVIVIFIKLFLEDTGSIIDKFKLSNLSCFRYFIQYIKYRQREFVIIKCDDKWTYQTSGSNEKENISTQVLRYKLQLKQIHMDIYGTYYFYNNTGHSIKVVVSQQTICIYMPNIDSVVKAIEFEYIKSCIEHPDTGKTIMMSVFYQQTASIQLEAIKACLAIEMPNYKRLRDFIECKYFVGECVNGSNSPSCINFNGPPGTGKTTFASYIATKNIFDRILIFNLVQVTGVSDFKSIMLQLERSILGSGKDKDNSSKENILLVIDEVDKWLEVFINNTIQKKNEEIMRQIKQVDKEGKTTETKSAASDFSKEERELEDQKRRTKLKEDFLDQLYCVAEGQMLKNNHRYFIIFNTNDYEKIFSGVDEKRFLASRKRVEVYQFDEMNREVAIDYITKYIHKVAETQPTGTGNFMVKKPQSIIDNTTNCDYQVLQKLRKDIKISHRDLKSIMDRYNYKLADIVEDINKYHIVAADSATSD